MTNFRQTRATLIVLLILAPIFCAAQKLTSDGLTINADGSLAVGQTQPGATITSRGWAINPDGSLAISSTKQPGAFVNSMQLTLNRDGSIFTSGGGVSWPLLAPDGSATAPSYAFASGPGTGMYFQAGNILDWSINGVNKLQLTPTAFATNGPMCDYFTKTGCLTFANTSLTSSVPLLAPSGTAAASSYSFTGNPNSGMWNSAGNLVFSVIGVNKLQVTGTALLAYTPICNATPPQTGCFTFAPTSITPSVPLLALDGSAEAPSYSFSSSPNAGFYLSAGNIATSVPLRTSSLTGCNTPPAYSFTASPGDGMNRFGSGSTVFCESLQTAMYLALADLRVTANNTFGWTASTSNAAAALDTGLSRQAPAIVAVGNGAAGSETGMLRSGNTQRLAGHDLSTTNTTPQTLFAWSAAQMGVGVNWSLSCHLRYQTDNTTNGLVLAVSFGTAPTGANFMARIYFSQFGSSASGYTSNITTVGSTTVILGSNASETSVQYPAELDGIIELPGSASTFEVQYASKVSPYTITITRGSFCTLL